MWCDEGGDADQARVVQRLGDLGRAAEVFGTFFRRKAEVAADTETHVLTVEHDALLASVKQLLFQIECKCRLARTAQAGDQYREGLCGRNQLHAGRLRYG